MEQYQPEPRNGDQTSDMKSYPHHRCFHEMPNYQNLLEIDKCKISREANELMYIVNDPPSLPSSLYRPAI